MARKSFRDKTDEELEEISANYERDEFAARLADRELDRRESKRQHESDQREETIRHWLNFGCMVASFVLALAVCFAAIPSAWDWWVPRIIQFLHYLGY